MSNSYRLRTKVGVDKRINVLLEQDFEYLEILSLKLLQSQIYQRRCSDYGVIVGRVTANNGFGIPNVKVSVFTPLTDQDAENPIISELYPYKNINDLNEDGYRYNLLPYTQSHSGHIPVGTFFSREDVLTNPSYIEVFDKYYKYTALTNDSGDFMIFGVPVGDQLVHIDIDLSDIGEFSLSPQDLIRMGIATESQVAGNTFRKSTNLNELVQVKTFNRSVYVNALWGEPDVCNLSINRLDFDLTAESNINITPTAIFMGSLISSNDDQFQKRNCKPKISQGELCNLVAGPGQILAIRQTGNLDEQGRPILETFDLEQGGQVIDDNGAWLVDLPMNLNFVTTNEFGERIISNDPSVGIPTSAKYRFKIKWNQSPKLSEPIKRGYFLVPNVREYGWTVGGSTDPLQSNSVTPENRDLALKSYAFSLDWNDYADVQAAIDCEDTFYPFVYNKVYTISQLIDQYRNGFLPNRIIAVRNILDQSCESTNVKFPTNDSVYRFDLIYLLFVIAMFVFRPLLYLLLLVAHFVAGILWFFGDPNWRRIAFIQIPNLTYPECDLCECKQGKTYNNTGPTDFELNVAVTLSENAFVTPLNQFNNYTCTTNYGVQQLLVGNQDVTTPNPFSQAPQLESYTSTSQVARDVFTTSIPLFERINLFNTKAKYFDNDNFNNPGGGWNRIGVYFRPSLNGYSQNISQLNAQQYLDVTIKTNVFNIISPNNNTINPVSFPNQTVQPTIGPNPFSNVTNEYIVPQSGTYSVTMTVTKSNVVNDRYLFQVYVNNNPSNAAIFTQNTPLQNTQTFSLGNLNQGDRIYLRGRGQFLYNMDVEIELKITGAVDINVPSHLDNCTLMLVKPEKASQLVDGTIISFQDPTLSKDINTSGGTQNQFGTTSITGTSINNGTSNNPSVISVSWARPDGTGTNTTTYNITQVATDAQFAKYSMDIEYFQVITAMTINQYLQLCEPEPADLNIRAQFVNDRAASLRYRILFGQMVYNRVRLSNHCWDLGVPLRTTNLECFEDWENQVIVFMNRGVDPYSTRGEVEYDLSRLFGYDLNSNGFPRRQVTVRGNRYKLNIPIQGHYACVRHDQLVSDVTIVDPIMNNHIYYPSYHFLPDVNSFSAFTSDLPNYYLSLSSDYVSSPLNGYLTSAPLVSDPCENGSLQAGVSLPGSYRYVKLKNDKNSGSLANYLGSAIFYNNWANGFIFTWDREINNLFCRRYGHRYNSNPFDIGLNGGFYTNEVVDGGSVMYSIISLGNGNSGLGFPGWSLRASGFHYSPRYNGLQFNFVNNANNGRIIMRTDRLPTSTNTRDILANSFALQANELFGVYEIFDDGTFIASGGDPVGSPTFGDPAQTIDSFGTGNTILNTFTCGNMVPLGCYYVPTVNGIPLNEISVQNKPNGCYENDINGEEIMENGCYVFVTKPFDSLGRDILLLTEWTSRIQIVFGACRNIWSHIFTNNWINGTLYAFSFKNDRFFTSPFTNPPALANQPFSVYCKDTIVLHPTNNFYYRSSPYYSGTSFNPTGTFVGARRPETDPLLQFFGIQNYGGNQRNLKFPTTIVDLGPRSQYLQELVFSDAYDGFIMNRFSETSYKDVSEILNYLIVSRLANTTFIQQMLGINGANIMNFFDKRDKNFVDADYSQLLSISSELGVVEFESINYTPIDGRQDPLFFNSPLSSDPVIGIFYSSDTQTRDYLSPKRTIINPNLSIGTQCAFNYYDNFSQYVPFYQWQIKQNENSQYDSIFGSESNDWYTTRLSNLTGLTPTQNPSLPVSSFFYHRYQSLDRLNSLSRYYRPYNTSYSKDYKGYIYNVDYQNIGIPPNVTTSTSPYDFEYEPDYTPANPPNQFLERVFTVGAPYHFYFGLKKGKTAWDRFARKWLDLENFTD
jgi:hypothetical protein